MSKPGFETLSDISTDLSVKEASLGCDKDCDCYDCIADCQECDSCDCDADK